MRTDRGARADGHKYPPCIVDEFSMAGGMIGSSILDAIDENCYDGSCSVVQIVSLSVDFARGRRFFDQIST